MTEAEAGDQVRAVWDTFSLRYPGWRKHVTAGMVGPLVCLDWWIHGERPELDHLQEMVRDVAEAFEADIAWRREPQKNVRGLVRDLKEAVALGATAEGRA